MQNIRSLFPFLLFPILPSFILSSPTFRSSNPSNLPIKNEAPQTDPSNPRAGRQYQHFPISSFLPALHHSAILRPNINYLANGHPYKITVNDKELKPSTTTRPSTIINHTNSPVTWIMNTWGFNGQPVNIFSYPARRQEYWGGMGDGPMGKRGRRF